MNDRMKAAWDAMLFLNDSDLETMTEKETALFSVFCARMEPAHIALRRKLDADIAAKTMKQVTP